MTTPSWVRRRLVVAGCVLALGLAGCDAQGPDDAAPTSTSDHPAPEAPKDRDEQAVLAALARIDMCAVLGSAVAGTPRAPRPSTCEISQPNGGSFRLRVEPLSTTQRQRFPSRALGGAKAYVEDFGNSCAIRFPVSFNLALTIDVHHAAQNKPADPCEVAETATVATTLADPAAARTNTRWEACAALESVPGIDTYGPDPMATMDRCTKRSSVVVLSFKYSTPGSTIDGWQRGTVGGVEVWTLDERGADPPGCTVEWSQGPAASRYADDGAQLVASLRAPDCGQLTPLVEPLITTLRQPPPDVEPQRPLLYRPDEPDSPR